MIAWVLRFLSDFDEEQLVRFLKGMTTPVQRAIFELWKWQAHGGQNEPPPARRRRLADLADDGGARLRQDPGRGGMGVRRGRGRRRGRGSRWSAPRLDEVARVMVEGASGLLATARSGGAADLAADAGACCASRPGARPSPIRRAAPEKLRGPEHHFAWCDELAKWRAAGGDLGQSELGLRLGERPRTLVTTTPRPIAAAEADPGDGAARAMTHGRTARMSICRPISWTRCDRDLWRGRGSGGRSWTAS